MAPRAYHSDIRDQARQETHEKIYAAFVRVVNDEGVHAFTIRRVADEAGVAPRTVYRHFPTREALVEGLAGTLEKGPAATPLPVPAVTEWDAVLCDTFDQLTERADEVRAIHAAAVALRHALPARQGRTDAFRVRVIEAFPHLEPAMCTEAANLLRNVCSSANWLSLTADHGMSPASAKRASRWALQTLLADLEARNAAAGEG